MATFMSSSGAVWQDDRSVRQCVAETCASLEYEQLETKQDRSEGSTSIYYRAKGARDWIFFGVVY